MTFLRILFFLCLGLMSFQSSLEASGSTHRIYVYYQPNNFTPNGDGINDIFRPINSEDCVYENYRLLIWNRWGDLLFESNECSLGWDGTYSRDGETLEAIDDVYTWQLYIRLIDQIDTSMVTGHVVLIR